MNTQFSNKMGQIEKLNKNSKIENLRWQPLNFGKCTKSVLQHQILSEILLRNLFVIELSNETIDKEIMTKTGETGSRQSKITS